jgi:hypothetical protein
MAIAAGAVKTLSASAPIYRVRPIPAPSDVRYSSDVGPPPPEKAKQNRMSAAGIPMFYGSDDPDTALAETRDSSYRHYAIAEFRSQRELRMLDLTTLTAVPPFFELGNRGVREEMKFLHRFAEDISLPVEDPDAVHIEYVPTQAVTEYFRTVFREGDRKLDGIAYRSARRPGGRSLVLFATADDVVPARLEQEAGQQPSVSQLVREASDKSWLALRQVWFVS